VERGISSKEGVFIRLTDERWAHILDEHGELTGLQAVVLAAIADPAYIFAGGDGELIAVKEVEPGKYMVTVYRESAYDGFVITAFLTRNFRRLARRIQLWP
jgi:hypothetical protein